MIPVKALRRAKSRLKGQLDAEARYRLGVRMLTRVLGAVTRAGLAGAVVVTSDAETARLADELGARVLRETGRGLNAALEQGLAWAAGRAAAALVLPADLPLVEPDELRALLGAAPEPPCVVLSPASDGGTNALLLAPPLALRPAFGRQSARRHRQAAERARLRLVELRSPGLELDVDTPQQLAVLRRAQGGADG